MKAKKDKKEAELKKAISELVQSNEESAEKIVELETQIREASETSQTDLSSLKEEIVKLTAQL